MKRSRSDKLEAGKFRLLNEMLYTSHSQESKELFTKDPNYFDAYHNGFNSQISSWPVNPLTIVESEIRNLAKNNPNVLVDLGCGLGQLELNLKDLASLKVFSYDLISAKEHIIACDISQLPHQDKTIDFAIFCLSLMGTNHVQMIKEAHRVLKRKAYLIVAEVSTRFHQPELLEKMSQLGFKSVKKIVPNSFFSVFVFRRIGPKPNDVQVLFEPCKYKKR